MPESEEKTRNMGLSYWILQDTENYTQTTCLIKIILRDLRFSHDNYEDTCLQECDTHAILYKFTDILDEHSASILKWGEFTDISEKRAASIFRTEERPSSVLMMKAACQSKIPDCVVSHPRRQLYSEMF